MFNSITVALYCTVCETERKSKVANILYFTCIGYTVPVKGDPSEFRNTVWFVEN